MYHNMLATARLITTLITSHSYLLVYVRELLRFTFLYVCMWELLRFTLLATLNHILKKSQTEWACFPRLSEIQLLFLHLPLMLFFPSIIAAHTTFH